MTRLPKPSDQTPAVVSRQNAGCKPRTSTPASWPSQDKVKQLADVLDNIHREAEAMLEIDEQLGAATDDFARCQTLQKAKQVIGFFEGKLGLFGLSANRLQRLWDKCHPEGWRTQYGSPERGEVQDMVIILINSFPTSNIREPDIFVRMLVDDVMALEPSFVEMESTCRSLRRTKRFVPAISEVIEELEKQQKLWRHRSNTMEIIENFYEDLCVQVVQAKIEDRHAPMIEHRQELPMAPVETPDTVKGEEDF